MWPAKNWWKIILGHVMHGAKLHADACLSTHSHSQLVTYWPLVNDPLATFLDFLGVPNLTYWLFVKSRVCSTGHSTGCSLVHGPRPVLVPKTSTLTQHRTLYRTHNQYQETSPWKLYQMQTGTGLGGTGSKCWLSVKSKVCGTGLGTRHGTRHGTVHGVVLGKRPVLVPKPSTLTLTGTRPKTSTRRSTRRKPGLDTITDANPY